MQYAFLGKGVCYRTNCDLPPEIALGSDFTWNATPTVALDIVYDATLTAQQTPGFFSDGSVAGGRGGLLAAGPRLEVRREHYGLFISGQMGAELWTRAPNELVFSADGKSITLSPGNNLRTFFAVGAGAGAEYSPSHRWHVRTAVSERVVDYRQRYQGAVCSTCGSAPTAWESGEDFTAGVYKGFGAPVGGQGTHGREVHLHRFFDRWNNGLIAGAGLASVGDAVTTQLFLDKGLPEGSPIERTFVQCGVGGDIAAGHITC